jgi:hypothetical protein
MRNLIRITAAAAALSMPLAVSAAPRPSTEGGAAARLAQMCDASSRDIAGLPVDQIKRTVQINDEARAALDDLANALLKAAQDIKTACAAEAPLTAPARLAAMQTRLEAMRAAVKTVRPPLEKFYSLLSDEQKEQIIALGQSQRPSRASSLLDRSCSPGQAGVAGWPTADSERAVHPTEAQSASLKVLEEAAGKAADLSKGACPPDNPLTPTARLAAIDKRLDSLQEAGKTVSAPLNDFYAMLDDEQRARFNAISLPQTSQSEQPKARPIRHHFVSFGYFIRRLLHWHWYRSS